jgi:sugar/nucleoside kinase (ribokinase family)
LERVSVIGGVQADLIVWSGAEVPPPGTELLVENMHLRVGGAAGNAAMALAALGTPPYLICPVGEDLYGQFVLNELHAAGVRRGVFSTPTATGITVALEVPGEDRRFLTLLGSLETFSESMVPAEALAKEFVLLCDYFNLPTLRGRPARRLLEAAQRSGSQTLLDCAWDSENWPKTSRREIAGLLPHVDVFLPNEAEALKLTGSSHPLEAALALQDISRGWVVVKRGPKGVLAVGPRGEKYDIPAPPVDVVDTTGAGDSLNAALMHTLVKGAEMSDALDFATRAASTVVSRGSANRYPSPAEVLPTETGGRTPNPT